MSSALFAASIAVVLHAHGPLPTIETLIKRLHAPRSGITSFEVVIDAQKGEGTARPHIRRVWRDGGRYRIDFLNGFTDKGYARHIDSTNVPQDGMYFSVWYDPVFNPAKTASMKPLTHRRESGIAYPFRFEDLGATPESFGGQAHMRGIEWYTGREEWTEKSVERCKWKDLLAFKIVLAAPRHQVKATFEATLLPQRGHAVVHSRMTWEKDEKHEVRTSESILGRIAGMWLPTSSICSEFSNGKLTAKLTQTIDYVRLNKSPDPKVFTLEGMNLIRGTLVSTEDGLMVWDGSKLVPHRMPR
jgi:hypothetical protein